MKVLRHLEDKTAFQSSYHLRFTPVRADWVEMFIKLQTRGIVSLKIVSAKASVLKDTGRSKRLYLFFGSTVVYLYLLYSLNGWRFLLLSSYTLPVSRETSTDVLWTGSAGSLNPLVHSGTWEIRTFSLQVVLWSSVAPTVVAMICSVPFATSTNPAWYKSAHDVW